MSSAICFNFDQSVILLPGFEAVKIVPFMKDCNNGTYHQIVFWFQAKSDKGEL